MGLPKMAEGPKDRDQSKAEMALDLFDFSFFFFTLLKLAYFGISNIVTILKSKGVEITYLPPVLPQIFSFLCFEFILSPCTHLFLLCMTVVIYMKFCFIFYSTLSQQIMKVLPFTVSKIFILITYSFNRYLLGDRH